MKRFAWAVALLVLLAHGTLLWTDFSAWYPRWDVFEAQARAQELNSTPSGTAVSALPTASNVQAVPAVQSANAVPASKPRVRRHSGTHFSDAN